MNKEQEKEFDKLLKGIDKDECEDRFGWWETSAGAIFGLKKKKELKFFISKIQKQDRDKYISKLEKIKPPKMSDKDFDCLPDIKGIWYAGFSEAKKLLIKALKQQNRT